VIDVTGMKQSTSPAVAPPSAVEARQSFATPAAPGEVDSWNTSGPRRFAHERVVRRRLISLAVLTGAALAAVVLLYSLRL
jgi:hypothetical protein